LKKVEGKMKYLIFLAILVCFSAAASADTLCYYKGSDVSDGLNLTEFKVEGPSILKAGTPITVTFRLANALGERIVTSDMGVFAGARTMYSENTTFGSTFKNKVLEPKQSVPFSATYVIMKQGALEIWPSYKIDYGYYEKKFGPAFWHACVLAVCPDSCSNSIAHNFDGLDSSGNCTYTKERCEFGCDTANKECSIVEKLEMSAEGEDCFPYFTATWTTNLHSDSSLFYRKNLETEWNKVNVAEARTGGTYVQKSIPVALESKTTYFFYVKSCASPGCNVTKHYNITTPLFLKIKDVSADSSMISWKTVCDDSKLPSPSDYPTNFTMYIVRTSQLIFPSPPWAFMKNSSFEVKHDALMQDILELNKNYTFYLIYCDKFGVCLQSQMYNFKAVPGKKILTPPAEELCSIVPDSICKPGCDLDPDCMKPKVNYWPWIAAILVIVIIAGFALWRQSQKGKISIPIKPKPHPEQAEKHEHAEHEHHAGSTGHEHHETHGKP
jgi:hypothetical protein